MPFETFLFNFGISIFLLKIMASIKTFRTAKDIEFLIEPQFVIKPINSFSLHLKAITGCVL